MKVRILIACAATVAALPLGQAWASANATTLGGPQGTGSYGVVDPLDRDHDGVIYTQEPGGYVSAPPYSFATYDRNGDGFITSNEFEAMKDTRAEARDDDRNIYSGPSWATNPPAPAM